MVSVIIPTYNERPNVEPLLARLATVRKILREPLEVLIVDDASPDGTAELAEGLLQQRALGRVVKRQGRRDLAGAVLDGVRHAQGDLIGVMDADLSHPPELLPVLAGAVHDGCDLAIASRYVKGGGVEGWAWHRRWLSRMANVLAQPLTRVRDASSGYFVCQRRVIESGALRLSGFKILLELLASGRISRVTEVPYVFVDRRAGASKLSTRPMWAYLSQLARLCAARGFAGASVLEPGNHPVSPRARLSVVILTKNEEARIGRCLQSVAWADELVVVDGLSTDRTVELCRQAGARVVSHAFEGSFAQERNLGLEAAGGEWVLQIDADDVVTPAFRAAVERLLTAPQPHDAFKFRRKSYLMGRFMRHGGWYHYLPNLVRRGAVRYVGQVHERPVVRGSIGVLEADIEHHPCDDLAAFISRHNRYTSLQAQEMRRELPRLSARRLAWTMARRPWKTFWKSYVRKQGFREGVHGLLFAAIYAWIELVKWAKYWELSGDNE
ncbi:MAG: glycosyltransferase [Candidatus Omnitrophica bacterium]|nr:glycosyltransferase [Candidatus Omnitrophota bacterium]